MPNTPVTTMRLSPNEVALLDALAAHQGISRTDVVRRLIRQAKPPADLTPSAAAVRRAHDRLSMVASSEP